MFFDNWMDLVRILVIGVLAYISLVFLLIISGKRTLTKMNAFDLVVTVALGSTLATVLLSSDVSLAEGVLGFAVLIGLQFVVTFMSVRSKPFRNLVKSEPTLLFYQGEMLDQTLKKQRVTVEEVRAAMRAEGQTRLDKVEAVILETDGTFSVLPRIEGLATTALEDVSNYPPGSDKP